MGNDSYYKSIFDEVLRMSDDGFIVVNAEGIVTDISDYYCEFLGKSRENIINRPVLETIPNSKMPDIVSRRYTEGLALHRFQSGYIQDELDSLVLVSRSSVTDEQGTIVAGVAQVRFRTTTIKSAKRMLKEELELENLVAEYHSSEGKQYRFHDVLGNSECIFSKKLEGAKAARTDFPVLLTGETGTGKEVFAKAIHNESARSHAPLVAVNCAAIPDELFESELFGYVEGAFTGAKKGGKQGKFQQANGGTLFLDEIGDMPLLMQAKILRVLQEKEVDMVGGSSPVAIDVRIISATRRNLAKMVADGTFREDLYYRLNVINIELPPLRKRKGDIPCLVFYFLKRLNIEYSQSIFIPDSVIQHLSSYDWPGNLRELDNVIKGAYATCDGLTIELSDLPAKLASSDILHSPAENPISENNCLEIYQSISLQARLEQIESAAIQGAYEKFKSVRKAAEYLGMSMPTFVRKRKAYMDKLSSDE